MATLPVDLEIDRLMNLIRGFGWEMEKKEITNKEIKLAIKKEITTEKT